MRCVWIGSATSTKPVLGSSATSPQLSGAGTAGKVTLTR